ncbi:ABC transporter substrate-binding protein [Tardisphaera miroshnichenkoae]
MYFNYMTAAFVPAAATSVSEFPANNSFVVYLRKGLEWYNGSATMPFTAWDVYTYWYIENKVFGGYAPYLNYSLIKVLNDYTIEFTLNEWAPSVIMEMLPTPISTPYSVWKGVLANVTAYPNATVAGEHAMSVERFDPPAWFLGPYYTTISVPYIIFHLEPGNLLSEWDAVFPYHTWQDYSPTMEVWWTGGGGQSLNAWLAGEANYEQTGLAPAQFKVMEGAGGQVFLYPSWYYFTLIPNNDLYPLNITQVRLALQYAINETEAVDSWNAYGMEAYYAPPNGEMPSTGGTPYDVMPQWLIKATKYVKTPNLTEAAQLLESVGFTKKNGQWYMPNGKPFTLSIQCVAGWTDTATQYTNVASQWTEFGIPTQIYTYDYDTVISDMVPSGDFTIYGPYWGTLIREPNYALEWTIGWWWWVFPYNSWIGYGWQEAANYPITYPNGSKGTFNFNNWYDQFVTEIPMSAAFNQSMLQATAFFNTYWPVIYVPAKAFTAVINTNVYNITWVLKLPMVAQYAFIFQQIGPGWVNGDNCFFYTNLLGIAPVGYQSPLAEAIATQTLPPEYATFFGLNSTYSEKYVGPLGSAKISLSASPTSVVAGTPVTLTAKVTYANGTPVSDTSVSFYLGTSLLGSALTNSQGLVSFSYTPPSAGTSSLSAALTSISSIKSPLVTVTATAPTNVTKKTTVVMPSSLQLSASRETIPAGGSVTLTATAEYANGTPASGYAVAFYANSSLIATVRTSTNGQASYLYTPSTIGIAKIACNLVSAPSVISNTLTLNVTKSAAITTPTPTATTTSSMTLYAIVAAVVVIVVVVAVVLALSGRGKRGPQSHQP